MVGCRGDYARAAERLRPFRCGLRLTEEVSVRDIDGVFRWLRTVAGFPAGAFSATCPAPFPARLTGTFRKTSSPNRTPNYAVTSKRTSRRPADSAADSWRGTSQPKGSVTSCGA